MATCFTISAKAKLTNGRDEVYVAAVPLRATKGPAQLVMSTAYSLNLWDLQHFMVLIKSNNTSQLHSQAIVFDFQPKDPENIQTAVAVLSGGTVPGVVQIREMKKLPRRKCWYVGFSSVNDAVSVATKFSESWETDLKIGHHDCRNYTNGLIELLTGKKLVLESLRRSNNLPEN